MKIDFRIETREIFELLVIFAPRTCSLIKVIFAAGCSRDRVVPDPVCQWRDEGEDVGQLGSCRPGGGLRVKSVDNLPMNVEAHPMLKDATPISS